MLNEAKLAMQVSADEYDAEIASLLMSAANDMTIAGITLDGEVTFTVDGTGAIVDSCTVEDPMIIRALITYAQAHANWQPDAKAERFRLSYRDQLERLMSATGYTTWGDEGGEGT